MIIDGLFIGVPVALFLIAAAAITVHGRREDRREERRIRRDPFASYGLTVSAADAEDLSFGPMPPEIAHDHADLYGPGGAGIRHRYAPLGDTGPAPYETSPAPPPLHHDHYGPDQRYHDGPPDPAAAVEHIAPQALPPPPAGPLAKALAAVRDIPVDGYLHHVGQATAYEDRPPLIDLLSDETIARGIPAIRVDGDADGPLSIPPEVIHEMEAGV